MFSVFLNWNCDTVYIWVFLVEIPNKYFVYFMSYFTNIFKSPLAHWMKHSQGRECCLFISRFKAMHNPPSQLVGEVCLQIILLLWWPQTHLSSHTSSQNYLLGHSHFQLPCNPKHTWTHPSIWNWYAATIKGPSHPSGGYESIHVEWPRGASSNWAPHSILSPLNSICPFSPINRQRNERTTFTVLQMDKL